MQISSLVRDVQPELGLSVTQAARRRQIIEATIATIGELGYAQTSFARVMQRAGLSSTRIITYHFTTKAGLMQAVLSTVVSIKESFLAERVGDRREHGEALRGYIESELAFLAARPSLARVLAEFAAVSDRDGWAMAAPVLRDLRIGRLARQLRQGQQDGAFGDFDPDVAALVIAQAIDGAAAELLAHPDLDTAHYAEQMATFFTRATRPPTRSAGGRARR